MKRRSPIVSVVLFLSVACYSQEGSFSAPLTSYGGNMRTTFNLGELMGTKINFTVADDPHIKGNPFYRESFSPSIIILKNGAGYSGLEIRMNLSTNDIHFKTSDSTELVAGKGIIRKLILFQNGQSPTDSTVFSSGYPPIDHNDENTFYEELSPGRVRFLKFTYKVLSSVQSIAASPLDKQYVDLTAYYLASVNPDRIEKWHKGKDFIVEFLSDKKDSIKSFIESHGLKCKSQEEIEKVLRYYNSLN